MPLAQSAGVAVRGAAAIVIVSQSTTERVCPFDAIALPVMLEESARCEFHLDPIAGPCDIERAARTH